MINHWLLLLLVASRLCAFYSWRQEAPGSVEPSFASVGPQSTVHLVVSLCISDWQCCIVCVAMSFTSLWRFPLQLGFAHLFKAGLGAIKDKEA